MNEYSSCLFSFLFNIWAWLSIYTVWNNNLGYTINHNIFFFYVLPVSKIFYILYNLIIKLLFKMTFAEIENVLNCD